MNAKYALAAVLAIAVGGAVLFYAWEGIREPAYVSVPVKRMPLEVQVAGAGRLEAAQSVRITTTLWWKAITWLIPEGSFVKKGDIIAKFERKELENEVRTAKADYAVSVARLEEAKKQLEAAQLDWDARIKSYEADLVIATLELKRLKDLPRPDDVRQKEAELRRAKAEFDVAQEEYSRMARFRGQGYTTETELRKMLTTMKEAEAAHVRAQTQLRITRLGATPDEIREAELKVEQARISLQQAREGLPGTKKQLAAALEKQAALAEKTKNNLDTKERDLGMTDLAAPADGMVVYRAVEGKKIAKGVKAWKGCAIMDLPDLSKMVVKTKIREDYIHLVKVGQKVLVQVHAIPSETFTGKVSEVGKIAKDKAEGEILGFGEGKKDSGIRIFEVTVALDQADKRLVPNLIARIEILVDNVPDALVIPKDAVRDKAGKKVVSVERLGGAEEREVELGLETEDLVAVKSGLEEDEMVCLSKERRRDRKPVALQTERAEKL